MKKLIFSAIAMVAFMGSSMANESQKNCSKKKSNIKREKILKKVNCHQVAMAYLDAVDPDYSLSQAQVDLAYQIAYGTCNVASRF